MIKNTLMILIGFLGLTVHAFPGTNELSVALTLHELVDTSLADNPRLRAAGAKWEAMKHEPAQRGTLANPMFAFQGMDMANDGDFPDTNEKRYEIEQSFPWFGKRGLQRRMAEKEAEAMQYEYETMAHETVMDVKVTYYELHSLQQILRITQDEADVLKRLETVAQSVYATGQAGQEDVLKAQSETTLLKSRIIELEAQIIALKSKLNVLLGRPAETPIEIARPDVFPQVDQDVASLRAIVENRPEIEQAKADLARSQIERRLMGREFFPDYRLGVEYRTFRKEDPSMAMFMVAIDLPVWQSKYRAGVKQADRMVASNESALEAARKQAGLDVQQAYFNAKSARETLDLYQRTLIPQAQSRFDASEAGYRAGAVSFMELLDSQRFLLHAQVMAAMAESNLGIQLARLERALGTDWLSASPERTSVSHQGAEHER